MCVLLSPTVVYLDWTGLQVAEDDSGGRHGERGHDEDGAAASGGVPAHCQPCQHPGGIGHSPWPRRSRIVAMEAKQEEKKPALMISVVFLSFKVYFQSIL